MTAAADVLVDSTATASTALTDLERLLGGITDAELHYADPEGGWTCAQVVSHISLSALLWIADMERLRHGDGDLLYREEVGHDALGAPPHSAAEAADRVRSIRVAVEQCLPAVDPVVLGRAVEITTLGRMTVAEWMPLIIGHVVGHVDQIRAILRTRGVLPDEG